MPPNVATVPVSVMPAARYPARNAASAVLNRIGFALSISTASGGSAAVAPGLLNAESMSAKCTSGLASAADWIGSSRRKPTPMMRLQPCWTRLSMFGP